MTMPEALKQNSPPPHQSRKTARELRGGAARSQHVEQFSPGGVARSQHVEPFSPAPRALKSC
jgi:hypothetical protein